ncbi:MAG: KpsF/GutQ family sugar-phosphate isomerase [Desulfobulbaceae bacterium]|nr:KpsF/GutQ family sugar-phosphate isomerase [Desulfobulbaceae bacterium]
MSITEAKKVLAIEAEGLRAVHDQLGPEFDEAVELILACPSRLVVTGIGKSGIVGQKIAATLNSTGTPAFFLHPVEAMHGDLGLVASTDVVLALSYSGETAELNQLLHSVQQRHVPIIALCGRANSTLGQLARVFLNAAVPREACPLGLAPTASTTAMLALGDALAVVLLERKQFRAEDFRRNHPGGSLGTRLKVAIREVMLTGKAVPRVTVDTGLAGAVAEMNEKNLGAVFVVGEQGELAGIVTDGDLRRNLSTAKSFDALSLRQVMTVNPLTIYSDLLAADALSQMQQHEITVLAVVDRDKRFQGMVHLHDLLGKGEFRFLV